MTCMASNWALWKAPLSNAPTARLVLLALSERAHDGEHNAISWINAKETARQLQLREESVNKALKRLERHGLIEKADWEVSGDWNEQNRPVAYILHLGKTRKTGKR